MRNVSPAKALLRRSQLLLQFAFVFLTGGIFLGVVGLALYAIPVTSAGGEINPIVNLGRLMMLLAGAVLFLIGAGMVIRAVTWKTDNDLAMITAKVMMEYVDDRYTLIRNINGRPVGYVDALLVGPGGVLVFRITDMVGKFLNERSKWLKRANNQWKINLSNPTQDALDDLKSVRDYLVRQKLEDVPVYAIVVLTQPEDQARLMLKDPVIPVVHLDGLVQRLHEGFLAKERVTNPKSIEAVVKLFYKT
jgi:hypothetical protein